MYCNAHVVTVTVAKLGSIVNSVLSLSCNNEKRADSPPLLPLESTPFVTRTRSKLDH